MFKNNIKIAWRSLRKNKAYSLINIIGLSTGIIACLLVATVVIDELSYDHQWQKGNSLYRILSINRGIKNEDYQPLAASGLGPSLKRDIPEVENYCRASVGKIRLQLGEEKDGVVFKNLNAEVSIFDMFDFRLLQGDPRRFIKGYANVVISKRVQQAYFKDQDPVGKTITTIPDWGKPQKYIITGVMDDIPQNTHLNADLLTIGEYRDSDNRLPKKGEGYTFEPQYILLKTDIDIKAFTRKVNNWYGRQASAASDSIVFQPVKDVYLKSNFPAVQLAHGNIQNVYMFSAVAALLLLIACLNFINLTISRIFSRAKETGIRKVLGAGKRQLMIRFLSESVLFFALSFLLAVFFYPILLGPVQSYLGHPLVINLYHSFFMVAAILGIIIISIGTGLYPAWYLSRPKPVAVLKDKLANSVQLTFLKKALVVGQFVISVVIIIVTIVVHNQLNFISSKDLGFDKNNLLNLSFAEWGASGQAFKNSITHLPGVEGAAISGWYPSAGAGGMSTEIKLQGEKINVYYIQADADLPSVLKMKLRFGRIFDPKAVSDVMDQDSLRYGSSKKSYEQQGKLPFLTTAYTAAVFGVKVNNKVSLLKGWPVGIVNDFYSESLHNKIKPTVIQAVSNPKQGCMLIRIKPGSEKQALTNINRLYKAYYPEKAFTYNWLADQVDEQYKNEFKQEQLFTCFSMLIVFLACLGLFGLVSFTAEQRVKEIGIRKVLGAGIVDIVSLISKDYLLLILAAILIASPVAWYAMSKWLQNFAYRISIQWWMFVFAGIMAMLIAFITISFQSIKAALINPVKSLRNE